MSATDEITATPRPWRPGGSPSPATVPGLLRVAAIASLGAGAIHATAAGAHGEHRAAVVAFALTAAAQLGWGGWALGRTGGDGRTGRGDRDGRTGRLVGLLGAAVNGAALGGWLQAKTGGISFVAGLETREGVRFPDALAALLALVAVAGALATVAGLAERRRPGPGHGTTPAGHGTTPAGHGTTPAGRHTPLVGLAAIATVALVIPGMVATSSHSHAGADGHDHTALPPPVPYRATLPVDLGGVPGVSAAEVAEAEALVTETLRTLPRFADIETVESMGYRTIGDADTGFEHFVNWELIADGRVLDPAYPESLVFTIDPATGEKTLSAAMFTANQGDTLDTTPDLGGALVQWHIHDDLCFQGAENDWRVAGVREPGLDCWPGTFRLSQSRVPMVHVWIVPHECGPFAALEGDGAGQIRPGEERLCDHAHGAG